MEERREQSSDRIGLSGGYLETLHLLSNTVLLMIRVFLGAILVQFDD